MNFVNIVFFVHFADELIWKQNDDSLTFSVHWSYSSWIHKQKKFQSTQFQQGNRKWLTGLKWFNFPWITDGKCWDPFLCSFIACFVLLFLKSFFAKIIFSEEVKLWKNCAHNRVQRYLSKESVNDESHHSTAHELTYARFESRHCCFMELSQITFVLRGG